MDNTALNQFLLNPREWLTDFIITTKWRTAEDSPNQDWFVDFETLQYIPKDADSYVGFLSNQVHWILYRMQPRLGVLTIWDSMRTGPTSHDLRSGVVLISNFLQYHISGRATPMQIDYEAGVCCVNDGYNCGVYCLLQLEILLSGSVSIEMCTLDTYREKIRKYLLDTVVRTTPAPDASNHGDATSDNEVEILQVCRRRKLDEQQGQHAISEQMPHPANCKDQIQVPNLIDRLKNSSHYTTSQTLIVTGIKLNDPSQHRFLDATLADFKSAANKDRVVICLESVLGWITIMLKSRGSAAIINYFVSRNNVDACTESRVIQICRGMSSRMQSSGYSKIDEIQQHFLKDQSAPSMEPKMKILQYLFKEVVNNSTVPFEDLNEAAFCAFFDKSTSWGVIPTKKSQGFGTKPTANLFQDESFKKKFKQTTSFKEITELIPSLKLSENGVACLECESAGFKKRISFTVSDIDDVNRSRLSDCKTKIKSHLKKKHQIITQPVPLTVIACKNLESILQNFPVFERSPNGLICTLCKDETKGGIFKYTDTNSKNKSFSNLKQHLAAHLSSATHTNRDPTEVSKEGGSLLLNYRAGMTVGNNAYRILKTGGSFTSIETDILLDVLKNCNPGEINHSRQLLTWFLPATAEILFERLKTVLNTPLPSTGRLRPVSFLADKFTPHHESLQIIGLLFPYKGKMEYFVCDTVAVTDHTGFGIAKDIFQSLKQLISPQMETRLVGGSGDGQYHKLGVMRHILKAMDVPEALNGFYSFTWDAAHMIELAASSSRGQHGNANTMTVNWLKTTLNVCGDISRKYKWGKNFYTLRELYNRISFVDVQANDDASITVKKCRNPRTLKQWSCTRFAAYLHDFLSSFMENYNCLSFLANEADESLQSLRSIPFILRLNFLIDMYKLIGESSQKVQRHDLFVWQVHDEIRRLGQSINSMADTIALATDLWVTNPYLCNLTNALSEVRMNGTFRGEPALSLEMGSTTTGEVQLDTCVKQSQQDFIKCARDFTYSLQKRMDEQLPNVLRIIAPIFSITSVISRNCNSFPPELKVVYDQYKQVLFPDIEFETIQDEYLLFQEHMRDQISTVISPNEEVNFYMKLLDSPNKFPAVSHLLASCCTRTYCESIVEGTGSIAKELLHGRESMTTKTFRDSLFVRVNGPNCGEESQKLIEEVLTKRFGGYPNWHFYRTSRKDKLVPVKCSKVVDRKNIPSGRLAD